MSRLTAGIRAETARTGGQLGEGFPHPERTAPLPDPRATLLDLAEQAVHRQFESFRSGSQAERSRKPYTGRSSSTLAAQAWLRLDARLEELVGSPGWSCPKLYLSRSGASTVAPACARRIGSSPKPADHEGQEKTREATQLRGLSLCFGRYTLGLV